MKKIVFFDIDGTLLDQEKKIPDSTREALFALKRNGVHVAIATGRAPFMFEKIRTELEIDHYVSFNGQYVVWDGEVLYHNPISPKRLESLEKEASGLGHPMVFMNHGSMSANADGHPWIIESISGLKVDLPSYRPRFYADCDIYQALLFCRDEDEGHYASACKDDLRLIRWHRLAVDVLPRRASKAEGIRTVISRLGLDMDQVCAFGDAANDVEMLREAGTGVAMGNAEEVAKQAADWVTRPVDEDGIYYGLKTLGLI